jgi:hypothetical protein
MVRACQRWDLQMPCSQNWPYSAFRFAPPRDNSRIIGKPAVIGLLPHLEDAPHLVES